MAKITGLGGIFHVVKDPEATRAWYKDVLGLEGEHGPVLRWSEESHEAPFSLVSHFSDNQYLAPSQQNFMVNFRVDDLDGFVEALKSKGIEILGQIDEPYGKFAWILDCDGVKLEFWEQIGGSPD